MGGAVFPPFYVTWSHTMVEVTKIMVTSFKRSHACTSTLSATSPAAGQRQPLPPPETPGPSWASLGQSLLGSLLLSLGSWCTRCFVCPLHEFVSPVLCKFSQLWVSEWVKSLSHVWLFATAWTIAYQAPQSMEFSRQEYWSGLPFPSPGGLPNPGIESRSPAL